MVLATIDTSIGVSAGAAMASITTCQAARSAAARRHRLAARARIHRLDRRRERRRRRIRGEGVPAVRIALVQRLGVLDPQASAVETGAQIPGNESGMHGEDGADRVEVVAREAECAPQPCRGDGAGADPLRGGDALGRGVVGALGDGDHQGPHQQMVLHEKLAADAEEGRSRQTLEGEVGIERAAVILPAVAIAADRVEAKAPRDATSRPCG